MRILQQEYKELASKLLSAVKKVYKKDLITCALFGLVARGTASPESDIDILIIVENLPRGRMNRMRDFDALESLVMQSFEHKKDYLLSPILKTPKEVQIGSPLFWDMTEHIILLFDKNNFFREYLNSVRNRLAELKAKKVELGNAWYWVIKKDFKPGEIFEI